MEWAAELSQGGQQLDMRKRLYGNPGVGYLQKGLQANLPAQLPPSLSPTVSIAVLPGHTVGTDWQKGLPVW